ncbi:hypothetical protein STCU_10125 [Strigomonas culicis]|uniref:Uncharacterized protein n=1 Tax=Strigomonas culicis TaxID=28005 RepID=S9TNB1_9TRYP|nr:hypothetical protein STCU_10125 [Strigomonas culicis]|eukprot:EPY18219.1 hypothetical protein STCU_10125 [Strigomonas culicis]
MMAIVRRAKANGSYEGMKQQNEIHSHHSILQEADAAGRHALQRTAACVGLLLSDRNRENASNHNVKTESHNPLWFLEELEETHTPTSATTATTATTTTPMKAAYTQWNDRISHLKLQQIEAIEADQRRHFEILQEKKNQYAFMSR